MTLSRQQPIVGSMHVMHAHDPIRSRGLTYILRNSLGRVMGRLILRRQILELKCSAGNLPAFGQGLAMVLTQPCSHLWEPNFSEFCIVTLTAEEISATPSAEELLSDSR